MHRYFTPPAPEPQADGDGTYERSGAPQMPGLLSPAELIYDLERRAFDEDPPFVPGPDQRQAMDRLFKVERSMRFDTRPLRSQPFDPRD